VVSHDRYFLDRVATSILAFEGDGRVGRYVGDYSTYSRLRLQRERAANAAPAPAPSKAVAAGAAEARPRGVKLTYKETKELAEIEDTIAAAEREVAKIDQELGDPELYRRDPARAVLLGQQVLDARQKVQTLMERWQELESKKEASLNA